MLIPECAWPGTADTFDPAAGTGCIPRSMLQICEVPSGSVIDPATGAITTPAGQTVMCDAACSPAEYAVECRGPLPADAPGSTTASVPEPDAALGCRVVPIPTPPNVSFNCCPCGG